MEDLVLTVLTTLRLGTVSASCAAGAAEERTGLVSVVSSCHAFLHLICCIGPTLHSYRDLAVDTTCGRHLFGRGTWILHNLVLPAILRG